MAEKLSQMATLTDIMDANAHIRGTVFIDKTMLIYTIYITG